jgi:hypothetical protein
MTAVDIHKLMKGLAARRPIFHSEADFQFALAWHIQEVYPDADVRLEYPIARPFNDAVDILVRRGGSETAIELKYGGRAFLHMINGEWFHLKETVKDIMRHGILKDVMRSEAYTARRPEASAVTIALSNHPDLWNPPSRGATNDEMFLLHESAVVTGRLEWHSKAAEYTRKKYAPIDIKGVYSCAWRDYSTVSENGSPIRYGRFRYLCVTAKNDEAL